MREETRRKFDQALRRERMKRITAGVALAALAGVYFVYTDLDAHVDNVRVPATVLAIGPANAKSTRTVEDGLTVDVALQDGRHVQVLALKRSDPHVGDHVQVTEHRHHSGRTTYTWK